MSSPINSEHIKRPMNGFMIWSNEERQNIRKIYPNAPNSDISIILGQMWNNMSKTYKLTYYEKATKLKIFPEPFVSALLVIKDALKVEPA